MLFMLYCQLHCFRDHVYFKYMSWVGCILIANHNWSYKPAWHENFQIDAIKTKKMLNVIDSDGTLESIIAGLLNRFGRSESI